MDSELAKYSSKFFLAMFIQLPIFLLMWVVPYLSPKYMTSPKTFFGRPVYIVLLLLLSSFN